MELRKGTMSSIKVQENNQNTAENELKKFLDSTLVKIKKMNCVLVKFEKKLKCYSGIIIKEQVIY